MLRSNQTCSDCAPRAVHPAEDVLAGLATASPVKERKKGSRAQSQHLIQAHVGVFRHAKTGSFRIVASMATAALVTFLVHFSQGSAHILCAGCNGLLKHHGARLLLLWELSVLTCQALKHS